MLRYMQQLSEITANVYKQISWIIQCRIMNNCIHLGSQLPVSYMHDQEGAYSDQSCMNYCAHPGYLLSLTKITSGFTLGALLLATVVTVV